MSDPEDKVLSDKDAFANAYYYFVQALEVLAADASTQCDRMGNFNVAWEIKDDVVRGASVMYMPNNDLASVEKNEIANMVATLDNVPVSLLVATTTRAANMAAMKHPVWIPIRAAALKLLRLLDHTTRNNQAFLFRKN